MKKALESKPKDWSLSLLFTKALQPAFNFAPRKWEVIESVLFFFFAWKAFWNEKSYMPAECLQHDSNSQISPEAVGDWTTDCGWASLEEEGHQALGWPGGMTGRGGAGLCR